uniref:Integron gene cassette protein n=1 Tax=Macrostomum lignano TaxID=282301 RepID=A0A1I8FGK9_9PLAT
GQFGVPQTRRRLIILAAAPGRQFAQFPIAVHSFSPKACAGLRPASRRSPIRTTDQPCQRLLQRARFDQSQLADALSGPAGDRQRGASDWTSRRPTDKLTDHVTKQLTPLVEARLALIPLVPELTGATCPMWRSLSSDGSLARRLRYTHGDRGVCPCAIKPRQMRQPGQASSTR